MGSKKRSALKRQRDEFWHASDAEEFSALDEVFDRESHRHEVLDERREAIREHKACTSKQRYASRREAEMTIAACAAHGTHELRCYRCTYCHGWHLTSHPT